MNTKNTFSVDFEEPVQEYDRGRYPLEYSTTETEGTRRTEDDAINRTWLEGELKLTTYLSTYYNT